MVRSRPSSTSTDWKRKLRSRSFLVLLVPTVLLGLLGYHLETEALPNSGLSSGQIAVTVYVSKSPAHVSLTSTAYLDPQYDIINVNVTGPKAGKDPWILVVQCPPGAAPSAAPRLYSESTSSPSGRQDLGNVIVSNHDKSNYSGPLGCFRKRSAPKAVAGQSIDVTLPVLEQNPSAQSAPTETPLYVERSEFGPRNIVDLVEVLQPPNLSCPSSGSTSSTTAAGGAPASPAISGTCYTQVAAGTIATKYYFPSEVTTSETLSNVNLSNYATPSLFPPGQITSDGVKWEGTSSLSPSLSATSQGLVRKASIDNFVAGAALGLCGGFLVPVIQGLLPTAASTDDKKKRTQRISLPDAAEADGRAST
jgi:hypothetical protein